MQLVERLAIYREIEAYRKRPLIVYATSTRPGLNVPMAADAVREFVDQILAIKNGDAIDVMINSTGGDALTAWKLMSVLRERFDKVGVLVPYMAFSAATIFALGADEIAMHPFASLGPIDPQITIALPDGKMRGFAYEDVGAFLRFLVQEAKVGEPEHSSQLVDRLLKVVDPVHVGAAKRASELANDVGARLLSMHMDDSKKAVKIAEGLNKSFFAHGDAVSRTRAIELNLKITDRDLKLEDLLWRAFLGLEGSMELREPFIPGQHVLANAQAAQALKPSAPLVLPANTPPQVVNQLWTQVAQQALAALTTPSFEVPYDLLGALVESPRLASEARAKGYLSACRLVGGELKVVRTDTETKWHRVPIPEQPQGDPAQAAAA